MFDRETDRLPGAGAAGVRPDDDSSLDPGLQAERTGLAWTRTTPAIADNAALVVRGGLSTHDRPITRGGILVGECAVVVAVAGRHRHDRIVREVRGDRHPLEVRTMRLTTAVTALAAVTVIGSMITSLVA